MTANGPFRLEIPRPIVQQLLAQGQQELPNECCGLLAGNVEAGVGRVTMRYPLVNAAASPTAFDAEVRGLFHAFREMRELCIDPLAIYHSHPTSDAIPSKTDLAKNYWGNEIIWLILSYSGPVPIMCGWWLDESTFRRAEVTVLGE